MGDASWFSLVVRFVRADPLRRPARLLLWGGVGWGLADTYAGLTAGGPWTLTLLVLWGAAVGGAGSLACGLGGGAGLLLQGVAPTAVLWWFVPLVLVFGIVQWSLAEAVSSRRTGEVVLVITGYGLDEPGHRLPRLVRWLAHGALVVPLVLWAREPALSSLAVLGLVGLMHQQFLRATRSLSRYRRMEVEVSALAWVTGAALLALSPVGEAVAGLGREPLSEVLAGYLLVTGALSVALTVCTRFCERAFVSITGPPQGRHRTVFGAAYGFLLLPAWLGALALTVRPGTAGPAGPLAFAIALHVLFLALFMKRPCVLLYRLDASLFMRYTNQGDEEWLHKAWRYDATHGRGGTLDLTLVQVLNESAARISQGTFIPPAPEHWENFLGGTVRPVELSVHWSDKAVRLLNLTAPDEGAPREVRLEHRACRINCLTTLGYTYLLHGCPEDGQRALRDAAELCRRAGLPNIRVQIAKDAWLAGLDIGLDGLDPLQDALLSPHVVPALRARMLIEVGSFLHVRGDPRLDSFVDRMSRVPFHPERAGAEKIHQLRDTVTITAAGIGGRFPSSPSDLDVFTRGAEMIREQVPGNARIRAFVSGVVDGMLDVPGRRAIRSGVAQLRSGDPERGADILYRTALRLARRGLGAVAAELLELSGEVFAPGDPRRLACLEQAIALRDDDRTHMLGGDARIAYASTTEPLYEDVVGLLVDGAGDGVRAFDLVERARSRELVNLLGERVPRPELDGLDDVVAAMIRRERAAEEVGRSRARIGRAYLAPHRYPGTPPDDEDGWSPGLAWATAVDTATEAQRELFATMERLTAAGLDEEALELVWQLAREATAERSLRVEARRMRMAVDRAGPLRARRLARDRQLAVWDALADHGGRAAEYVALRRGTPLTFAQVRTLLVDAGSAGQDAQGSAAGEEVGGTGPDDRDDHGVAPEVQDEHVGDGRAG
ncbi:hypothetical protein [Streptomyces sp. WAC06614]|uniref:hypothetical protein n=1 Tax=Streptomyces sp. WAC06614 TaxID=2487416 RepID=UPI000F7A573D|nr:hypothetical protein [Streptomyces sp. WAC06614]RSS80671.1 hypothetical protein EF918_12815 [Streptomyces sp. WAC06614]